MHLSATNPSVHILGRFPLMDHRCIGFRTQATPVKTPSSTLQHRIWQSTRAPRAVGQTRNPSHITPMPVTDRPITFTSCLNMLSHPLTPQTRTQRMMIVPLRPELIAGLELLPVVGVVELPTPCESLWAGLLHTCVAACAQCVAACVAACAQCV